MRWPVQLLNNITDERNNKGGKKPGGIKGIYLLS
jgi:hypothetical protein